MYKSILAWLYIITCKRTIGIGRAVGGLNGFIRRVGQCLQWRGSHMAHRSHVALLNASQVKSSKDPLHSSILESEGDSFTTSLDADYIISLTLVIICILYWWI